MEKFPISAFIVSKNEGHLLDNCIRSVQFCDEIFIIDLESIDNTIEVAKKYGANIKTIKSIAIVESIHENFIKYVKNDWVIITDPDEITTIELANEIKSFFNSKEDLSRIGAVDVPMVYFFKSYKLKGTSWGGIKSRTYLVHKDRFIFKSNVHNGRFLKEGFEKYTINHNGKNHINHYWMTGYRQIFEKHLRYLKNEGQSRFAQGYTTSVSKILKTPFQLFFNCYIRSRGFKDGFVGLFLSLFRAWYFTAANIELYKYQRKSSKKQ